MYWKLYWNWNKTLSGMFKIGIMILVSSIIVQNLKFFNLINSSIPIGYLLLLILGILITRHIYQVAKWYLLWIKNRGKIENLIIHGCLYLIVVAVVLTVHFSLSEFNNSISQDSKTKYCISGKCYDSIDQIPNYKFYGKWTATVPNIFAGLIPESDSLKEIEFEYIFNRDGTYKATTNIGIIESGTYDVQSNMVILKGTDYFGSMVIQEFGSRGGVRIEYKFLDNDNTLMLNYGGLFGSTWIKFDRVQFWEFWK